MTGCGVFMPHHKEGGFPPWVGVLLGNDVGPPDRDRLVTIVTMVLLDCVARTAGKLKEEIDPLTRETCEGFIDRYRDGEPFFIEVWSQCQHLRLIRYRRGMIPSSRKMDPAEMLSGELELTPETKKVMNELSPDVKEYIKGEKVIAFEQREQEANPYPRRHPLEGP